MTMKRLNYFKGQFLQEDDFKDEQEYHVESQRLHNKNLHTWGIVNGLEVKISDDKKNLDISKGVAIDKDGKLIVNEEDITMKISGFEEESFYLTVIHEEEKADPEEWTGNHTRIKEIARFDRHAIKEEAEKKIIKAEKIILAEVTINPETEIIENIELEDRKYAGVGLENIADKSVPISKMKINLRSTDDPRHIDAGKEEEAVTITKKEYHVPSQNHGFFFTSVIPTTRDSSIEWLWKVKNIGNEIRYELWVKNTSKNPAAYIYKIYEISEN